MTIYNRQSFNEQSSIDCSPNRLWYWKPSFNSDDINGLEIERKDLLKKLKKINEYIYEYIQNIATP